MTRFIEADYYTYPSFRNEFYLIEGGDCRRFCLNTDCIRFFQEAELVFSHYPKEDRKSNGTRIVLNDGTVYYVDITYEKFKNLFN